MAPIVLFFVFGIIAGSFLNVVIYRFPRNQSLVRPGSHCVHCKTTIPFYRNIPIISFLIQGGRCHKCKQKISIQYPIVEFLSGIGWIWCLSVHTPLEAGLLILLFSIFIVIAWIDGVTMNIPFILIFIALIVEILGLVLGILPLKESIFGALVGVGSLGLIMLVTFLITKRQGMGFGDVQLGLVLGVLLGPIYIVFTFVIASFLSLIVWVGISSFKGFNVSRALPFAPFLITSGIMLYVMNYYLRGSILQFFI